MGVFTLHASNIKGFAFEFARVLCGLGLMESCTHVVFMIGRGSPSGTPPVWSELRPNPHRTRVRKFEPNPLMLLACNVDTPIHINRSHLLRVASRVLCGLGLMESCASSSPRSLSWTEPLDPPPIEPTRPPTGSVVIHV